MCPADEILAKVNKHALVKHASALNQNKRCFILGAPIVRPKQAILRIFFPRVNKCWAARFPVDQQSSFYESSIVPLLYIGNSPVGMLAPRIHDYVDGGIWAAQNPVGVAYILMCWIDGSPMQPWTMDNPPGNARRCILDQIADLMLGMLRHNILGGSIRFHGTVPIPGVSLS